MRAPAFWERDGPLPRLLAPAGLAFRAGAAARRALSPPRPVGAPVVCVGNLVAGGAGKTPVALSVGATLAAGGRRVAFLSRGYGGRLSGPVRVDPARHDARDVGDEALLLAELAPTWIARDRARGGRAAAAWGAEAIVMDDGFQNPGVEKALSLLVVDGVQGFGNGRTIPAGPLREPAARGLARADAVVLVGPDRAGVRPLLPAGKPVLRARVEPRPHPCLAPGAPVFGFAGIARPAKFRASLEALGLEVRGFASFPDHRPYRAREIAELRRRAAALRAAPATTAKDHARLAPAIRREVARIDIELRWDDPAALARLLDGALDRG